MVISSFISSILILALGVWAYMKLESSMNIFAEKQLLIEPSKFSYKMWRDMPVTMYQSFTFFNLTNWNQVKSVGQKPKFVEVGPYVYRTIWTKSDVNFMDEEKLVSFSERKQWIFQPHLSKGLEDDQIWTINTPLMTALALIQNAPVITRNIVSVILDGLGEGAFIKRSIRNLLFEGYSDLIVSVGPLFDRRFSNFNGKFAYLYNKNDSVDGIWTVSTGTEDLAQLNKITRFQSSIVNMTSFSTGQLPQGLIEVKPECAPAWSLDQATNGQLFAPFNQDVEQYKLQQQLQQQLNKPTVRARSSGPPEPAPRSAESAPSPKRFFSRSAGHDHGRDHLQDLVPNTFINSKQLYDSNGRPLAHHHNHHSHHHHHHSLHQASSQQQASSAALQQADKGSNLLRDIGKYIFYPDLCRPIHLLPSKQEVSLENGIKASRYFIDPRVFMNSTQVPTNKCYEMNPRPALANALAATINSVTGANVQMPNLVAGATSPFAMFSPPSSHHNDGPGLGGGLFERSNHPASFLNNALHGFGAGSGSNNNQQDQQMSSSNNAPVSRLGRVRQLFSNIVSQRMSAASPGSLLPSLASVPANILIGNHFQTASSRNSPDEPAGGLMSPLARHSGSQLPLSPDLARQHLDPLMPASNSMPLPATTAHAPPPVAGGSDRWITQFRFKWPRGVFSIGQCQLGAPIYASLPHFLDADEYYLEQVDGLKPNRSLHEFYIDVESTLHSIPVGAKARLQLNVATPELRFRNIPNAMIPVLWQEVTFEIDKPIASMLYWSFTMSSTIYNLVSISLLLLGLVLLVLSFVGGFKLHRLRRIGETGGPELQRGPSGRPSVAAAVQQSTREGHRSSWRPHILAAHSGEVRLANNSKGRGGFLAENSTSGSSNETLEEIRHGAALNHAFSSCSEFHDRSLGDSGRKHLSGSAPSSTGMINGGSPKQPSSRASSHCELVSSLGTQVNCAGCLLACLRHSPNTSQHHHHHHLNHDHCSAIGGGGGGGGGGSSDTNSIVRQQITTSDIDKATLSSRESNLDSCSSIYTQRTRTFK